MVFIVVIMVFQLPSGISYSLWQPSFYTEKNGRQVFERLAVEKLFNHEIKPVKRIIN